ncbi:MAG: aspartate-semialdehyde dehydrogenase [Thermoanaerobaculia bacterium]|nr:aspartate-semialdehyde dehydrogenase [Thermoanaerobaculia bacterium]
MELTERIPAAVLGATGVVGQQLVRLLHDHPWFSLEAVAASSRSAGRPYGEAAEWMLDRDLPPDLAEKIVVEGGEELSAPLLFSALASETASELEPLYRDRGHLVVSNASRFRMDPRVPLLIPEVNPESLELLRDQDSSPGGLITNPNCVVAGLALALSPLHREFTVEAAVVTTFQALSGAGYPGVPSLAALGNVIPHTRSEEEKIEQEPLKILDAGFPISASAHRVPVADGHLASVSVKLSRPTDLEEVAEALSGFRGEPQERRLPTAPERPLVLVGDYDRPQPLRDATRDRGMAVTVGRLRPDPVLSIRFDLLVHNTLRGAAGAALLNAELALARGLLDTTAPDAAVEVP